MIEPMPPDPAAPRPLDASDVQTWQCWWDEIACRIAPIFARAESRQQVMAYLSGLLSPAERKNSWQLAEISGASTPYGFQHLLGRAAWNPDQLRDALRSYVLEHLGDPAAIGVLDETGFLKKGTHSVGVTRHYTGTAGRVENCQIGVFLAYASPHGQTLLDRELYLSTAWTDDPARCAQAGVPADRGFATKPELARQMLERTRTADVELAWVTGDSVYGNDRPLRQWLENHAQAYVLGISDLEHLWIGHTPASLADLRARLAGEPWERHCSGMGSQGPRWYEWHRLALNPPPQPGWTRWVLFRRSCTDPTEVTAYRVFAPNDTDLATLARVVGTRWTVEESIQVAKGEVGLDHYEVRSWTGWYRHITLALWAPAFLMVVRAETGRAARPQKGGPVSPPPGSLARFKARRGLRSA